MYSIYMKHRAKEQIDLSLGKVNLKNNVNHLKEIEISKETNDVIILCNKILQRLAIHIMNPRVI